MRGVVLSRDEMLQMWKRAKGFEPVRQDCAVERTGGPDIDVVLGLQLDAAYVRALNELPVQDLPLVDVSDRVSLTATRCGAVSALLPPECVKVAAVMNDKWEREAMLTDDPGHPAVMAQGNPYSRSGAAMPVAVAGAGRVTVYDNGAGAKGRWRVDAVVLPDLRSEFYMTPRLFEHLVNGAILNV